MSCNLLCNLLDLSLGERFLATQTVWREREMEVKKKADRKESTEQMPKRFAGFPPFFGVNATVKQPYVHRHTRICWSSGTVSERDDLLSRLSYNSEIPIQSVWATILESSHMKRRSEYKLHTENEPLKTSWYSQSKSGANVSHILITSSHTHIKTPDGFKGG